MSGSFRIIEDVTEGVVKNEKEVEDEVGLEEQARADIERDQVEGGQEQLLFEVLLAVFKPALVLFFCFLAH